MTTAIRGDRKGDCGCRPESRSRPARQPAVLPPRRADPPVPTGPYPSGPYPIGSHPSGSHPSGPFPIGPGHGQAAAEIRAAASPAPAVRTLPPRNLPARTRAARTRPTAHSGRCALGRCGRRRARRPRAWRIHLPNQPRRDDRIPGRARPLLSLCVPRLPVVSARPDRPAPPWARACHRPDADRSGSGRERLALPASHRRPRPADRSALSVRAVPGYRSRLCRPGQPASAVGCARRAHRHQ